MTRTIGAVLPLVLFVLLAVAAVTFAMSVRVTMDTVAARSVLAAVEAEAQAEGALALAVAEQVAAFAEGSASPATHGPWPELDIVATVAVVLPRPATPSVVELVATAVVGSATARTTLTIDLHDGITVLARR